MPKGWREKLRTIPGWQDKVRSAIGKIIQDCEENETTTNRWSDRELSFESEDE
ncbi:MAG: hypothetical protein ACRC62_35570 [Microcoleus sp.]